MILDDGVFGTLQVLAVLVILFAPFLQGPPKHIQDLRMQRPLFLVRPFLQLLMHFRGSLRRNLIASFMWTSNDSMAPSTALLQ
jgi:hypothetical protein